MTTKDNFLISKENCLKGFSSNTSSDTQQYSNLNLNQTSTCSNVESVQSSSISNHDKQCYEYSRRKKKNRIAATTVEKLDSAINHESIKSSLQTWNKTTTFDSKPFISENEAAEKQKKKNLLKTTTNSSTLSLHISAYENSIEKGCGGGGDATSKSSNNEKDSTKKWQNAKEIFSTSGAQNSSFEFPRQQKDDDKKNATKPEVMQFRASQRLFNPNEYASSSSSSNAPSSSKGSKKNGNSKPSSSSSAAAGPSSFFQNEASELIPSQPDSKLRTSILEAIRTISSSDPALMESLKQSILELLLSDRPSDSIQEDLFNALGLENFELCSTILSQREQAIQVLVDTTDGSSNGGSGGVGSYDSVPRQSTPVIDFDEEPGNPMSNFIVQTKSQKNARKENRKDQKRAHREVTKVIAGLGETDKLEYQLALREHQKRTERQYTEVEYTTTGIAVRQRNLPYVFDAFEAAGLTAISVDSTKLCLPQGTEYRTTKEYQEIRVPPTPQTIPIEVKRIQIKDLDALGKLGFEGFKELNTIQSIVFEQAYHTVENLLICAPTGAGKTNIAMLSVLKTIRDHCKPDGTIDKNDFKIIYIAPMKALAAEMTENFSKRLSKLGLKVRELTGDTTLTKKEIAETQMLVLTPEKWDVVTRKADDEELTSLVRLLIIDEVHLLHDERGPVIETIVARTRRRIQMAQHKVRIVGLSATLPNYYDVATFLDINPEKGLFFFDGRFRPVPLAQTFIGVGQSQDRTQQGQQKLFDDVCYEKCLSYVEQYHQVLVFVHTRSGTHKTAKYMLEKAANEGKLESFLPSNNTTQAYLKAKKQIYNAKNRELEQLFLQGFGVHHAGMIRHHRSMVERLFAEGHIRVLCCTATLAWGVNLPAHAVIIRGTEVFDQQKGVFADIGVLDVQQIFGRAGRPQFESSGEGVIITNKSKLIKYVTMLIRQAPIESQYMKRIHDNLNAEIAAGTVSTIDEAVEWLRFTYFYVRARINPLAYGLGYNELKQDTSLTKYLNDFCYHAATKLDRNRMIVFDSVNGYLSSTDLGRIASHFYITYETIETVNSNEGKVQLTASSTTDIVLAMICKASEFTQIKARDTEMMELKELSSMGSVIKNKNGTLATTDGKVNCLLQSYISQTSVANFALSSEMLYIAQNASRIARAYFEIVLRKGWSSTTHTCLLLSKCIERKMWDYQTPLRQLGDYLRVITVTKIEGNPLKFFQLRDLEPKELENLFAYDGKKLYDALRLVPLMNCEATIKPVTGSIVQIEANISPGFKWNDNIHGTGSTRFWIFVEDLDEDTILHYEPLTVPKRKVIKQDVQKFTFTIPIRDKQMKHQFQIRISSDSWVVDDTIVPISLHNYAMPEDIRPHTDLLPLDPLPVSALKNYKYQTLYGFEFFNPIQTQVFYCLYQTDQSALIGAPTSSGKTLCAELAIFRILNKRANKKCVYIAPLKALVRERMLDWKEKFTNKLGVKVVEVSGDHTPDTNELLQADVLITTPEKWDGITRSWETREYVRMVDLVVIDEIHLLGVERGAVLEAIITRIKLIARKRELEKSPVRIVGLSTALANAADVAQWLDIKEAGLYNFRPSVRPVPIEVHIQGFPGQHYCPRMALMNKPAFKAIKQFSPFKPTLVFVASRRQTRITAMAFVTMLAAEDDPKQWLNMEVADLQEEIKHIKDENLLITLPFGIGMHHAGLQPSERATVERLFVEKKIQVLVATATLAWGINCPAHLVIVKGTEYFDGAQHKYVDFPVTDVLQMIGRAGRPQYDDSAVAVVYVQDVKKNFYKRFLYEPFPVESSLLPALPNHVNAEISGGTVSSKQQIIEYISGTYFYRRLFANPTYYGVEDPTPKGMTKFLTQVVDDCIDELITSSCIEVDDESGGDITPTVYGRICSNYYLEHLTIRHFIENLQAGLGVKELLKILADCPEYAVIPVRHNEESIQESLNRVLPIPLPKSAEFDSPHVKVYLLYQAHFTQFNGLSADYITDLRSIIDSCIRILQSMLDICITNGWLDSGISTVILLQQIIQGRWYWDHPLMALPALIDHSIDGIGPYFTIPQLQAQYDIDKKNQKLNQQEITKLTKEITSCTILDDREAKQVIEALCHWPILSIKSSLLQNGLMECPLNLDNLNAQPIPLEPYKRYKLRLKIQMLGPNKNNTKAYAPRFHKEKTASWIIFIGNKETNKIHGFTKCSPIEGTKDLRVNFISPSMPGNYTLTVFILSDSYLGIDQEYAIRCKVQN